MSPHGWIRRSLTLHRRSASIRNKRLSFGVERMAVIAPRDRMLALRVVGICICWKLPILVRNSHRTRTHLARVRRRSGRASMGRVRGGGWVESRGLPVALGPSSRRHRSVHAHASVGT